jgi:hypothetical protein
VIDPDLLAKRLKATSEAVTRYGRTTWQRADDWQPPGRMPARGERGGGMADGATDERHDDRKEDAAAGRYHSELSALTRRLDADMARLERIMAICCPEDNRSLRNKDLMAAQVAADGWCTSCWRDDQYLVPIALQKSGVPFYRDLCRACGEWKAEHRQLPPLSILVLRHAGRRVTTADVDKALGRPA